MDFVYMVLGMVGIVVAVFVIGCVACSIDEYQLKKYGCSYRHDYRGNVEKIGDEQKCTSCNKVRVCTGFACNGLGIADGATDTAPHPVFNLNDWEQ